MVCISDLLNTLSLGVSSCYFDNTFIYANPSLDPTQNCSSVSYENTSVKYFTLQPCFGAFLHYCCIQSHKAFTLGLNVIVHYIKTGHTSPHCICITMIWSRILIVGHFFLLSQEELEHLNEASAEINRLELQLDVSKTCPFICKIF